MYELRKNQIGFFNEFKESMGKKVESVIGKITEAIREQHQKTGRKIAVVGLSGGIDSALIAKFLVEALGKDNVIVVKMPYIGVSSDASIDDANLMIDFLQLPEKNVFEISINVAVDAILAGQKEAGITVEPVDAGNVMARVRMINLYAIARVYGGMVIDTCNFTEVILGYFTLHGDGAADYNPMGKMLKTLVWQIARYWNLPEEIIAKKPSAELIEGQNDEDDLGISYEAVDLMLWLLFEFNVSLQDLTDEYFYPSEVVEMVISRIGNNRYKNELPPTFEIE